MTKNLNLPEYEVLDVRDAGRETQYRIRAKKAVDACARCAAVGQLHRHGMAEIVVKDIPRSGRRVSLVIEAGRFRCVSCSKTFTETPPALADKRRMTARLVNWIGSEALSRSMLSIAEEVGIDEGTVRLVFADYVEQLSQDSPLFAAPAWLGIHDFPSHKSRCCFTDVGRVSLVDLLDNKEPAELDAHLARYSGVRRVTLDMWPPYLDAVKRVAPQASIIIPLNQLRRLAESCFDQALETIASELPKPRGRLLKKDLFLLQKAPQHLAAKERDRVARWVENLPHLQELVIAWRGLAVFFSASTPDEAEAAFEAWSETLAVSLQNAFAPILEAFRLWMPHILGHFDNPASHRYHTELDAFLAALQRQGRGISFEVLRARLLFSGEDTSLASLTVRMEGGSY